MSPIACASFGKMTMYVSLLFVHWLFTRSWWHHNQSHYCFEGRRRDKSCLYLWNFCRWAQASILSGQTKTCVCLFWLMPAHYLSFRHCVRDWYHFEFLHSVHEPLDISSSIISEVDCGQLHQDLLLHWSNCNNSIGIYSHSFTASNCKQTGQTRSFAEAGKVCSRGKITETSSSV